jgi:hypothetical protein
MRCHLIGKARVVPARSIPTPSTISAEAQACLSNLPPVVAAAVPDTEDTAAWRAHIDARNRQVLSLMSANAESYQTLLGAMACYTDALKGALRAVW